jgi:hypothetical protein
MPNQYTNNNKDKDPQLKDNDDIQFVSNKLSIEQSPKIPAKKQQQHEEPTTTTKKTIIPLSQTRENYAKANLTMPYIMEEDQREVFERQTKGKWTRKVTKIMKVRTLGDEEFLDWSEERTGKTQMGRKLSLTVQHVGTHIVPTPIESVQYDPDTDENKLVTEDREQEHNTVYCVPFTKEALQELIDDAMPHRCEFGISQEGSRAYSTNKKEMLKYADDFDTLYALKSDPNFKIVNEEKKREE